MIGKVERSVGRCVRVGYYIAGGNFGVFRGCHALRRSPDMLTVLLTNMYILLVCLH